MDPLETILHDVFGFRQFRGLQEQVIRHVLQGGNALVLMPTGGGKSLCYQLPALVRKGTAVVISPLLALMHNQVDLLNQHGIAALSLDSSKDESQIHHMEQQVLAGQCKLLYVAPERLLQPRFIQLLRKVHELEGLALFAVDEAHCISQWGHDFRPEYQRLNILHQRFPDVPRIALTATADAATQQEILQGLSLNECDRFVASFVRSNLAYALSDRPHAYRHLTDFIRSKPDASGIIYTSTRLEVERLLRQLSTQGIPALCYHAGLSHHERQTAYRAFMHQEKAIMIATVAFGMGIDKADLRFVLHHGLPRSLEAYYQETGRAGRDGAFASAHLWFNTHDALLLQQRAHTNLASSPREQERIASLLHFSVNPECRRVALLLHLGEKTEPCGLCDHCRMPPICLDATEAAQKMLSCIYRSGQRFGARHLVNILLGILTPAIRSYGHDRLSTFAIGREWPQYYWNLLIRQLLAEGVVSCHPDQPGLVLTHKSRAILFEDKAYVLYVPRTTAHGSDTNPSQDPLFLALNEWRSTTAQQLNLPASDILQDNSLLDLSRLKPSAEHELNGIAGLGTQQTCRYGAQPISAGIPCLSLDPNGLRGRHGEESGNSVLT